MTRYLLKARYNGNDTYKSCESNYAAIGFYNPKYLVSITGPTFTKPGSTIKVEGSVRNIYTDEGEIVKGIIIHVTTPDITKSTDYTVNSDKNGVFSINIPTDSEGIYGIVAEVPTANGITGSSSNALAVNTASMNTVLILSSSTKNTYVDTKFSLKAVLTDAYNKPLVNRTIKFYIEGKTSVLQTAKTNAVGEATIITAIGIAGLRKYQAVYDGESNYSSASTTAGTCGVTAKKHTCTFSFNQSTLYPNWYLSGYLRDESKQAIANAKVTITITNGNTKKVYTLMTNNAGLVKTPTMSLKGTCNIQVAYSDTTGKYNNYLKTFTIVAQNYVVLHNNNITAVNYKTGRYDSKNSKSYRAWSNLGNVTKEDNAIAMCGTSCADFQCIGTKSGTWNRPSPIKISDFRMAIPDNSIITYINVYMKIKSIWCENIANSIGAPKMTYKGGTTVTSQIREGKYTVIPNFYTDVIGKWYNISLNGSTFNSDDFYILIDFPANMAARKARLYLDWIQVNVHYQPKQGGV